MSVEIGDELLIGEEGNEETFEVVFTTEMNNNKYIVVALLEDLENASEDIMITAFRYTEDSEGTIIYDELESEDEWNEIESRFISYQEELDNETYSG
ncbi:DUF1292 domain-containing protein [Bacillus sp. HMF5848]|uniref:DUF1292 domain-containing protein n=1 Tax=Bacillus sp. HMF5848 TaxID=2495421 RepID=UPI000F7AC5A1|nr:DUF1292 domain-containing protein [Bacillus sp. HMF5848]RSK26638.1 DUF1292 domain-containing protein [Bacillus sp. HMF5848]